MLSLSQKPDHLSSIIVTTISLFSLGPSNSQKNIFCQVDNPGLKSIIGIVSEAPTRPAFKWASPLLSCGHVPIYLKG